MMDKRKYKKSKEEIAREFDLPERKSKIATIMKQDGEVYRKVAKQFLDLVYIRLHMAGSQTEEAIEYGLIDLTETEANLATTTEQVFFVIDELGFEETSHPTSNEPSASTENNVLVEKPDTDYEVIAEKRIRIDETDNSDSIKKPVSIVKNWLSVRWKCFMCAHCSLDYNSLRKHLKKQHRIFRVEDICFQCVDCGRLCNNYAAFLNHARRKHHTCLQLCCDVCGAHFKDYKFLSAHRMTHTRHPIVFHCSECERVYPNKIELEQHCENHRFVCEVCHSIFNSRKKLDKHQLSHATEKSNCTKCLKIFKSALDLKDHMHIDHKIEELKCQYCNETFENVSSRNQHERYHSGVGSYICEQCGAEFERRLLLMDHLRAHSEERPHKCEQCQRSFLTVDNLKVHMRTHSTSNFQKCQYCFKYVYKDSLKRHIRAKHKYICKKCTLRFGSIEKLSEHIQTECVDSLSEVEVIE